jgi:hypothetical protein
VRAGPIWRNRRYAHSTSSGTNPAVVSLYLCGGWMTTAWNRREAHRKWKIGPDLIKRLKKKGTYSGPNLPIFCQKKSNRWPVFLFLCAGQRFPLRGTFLLWRLRLLDTQRLSPSYFFFLFLWAQSWVCPER